MSIFTKLSRKTHNLVSLWESLGALLGMVAIPARSTRVLALDTLHDLPTQPSYASYSVNATGMIDGKNSKKNKSDMQKKVPFIIGIVIVVVIVLLGITVFRGKKSSTVLSSSTTSSQSTQSNSKAVQQINKQMLFPVNDANGKVITQIKYDILTAELTDSIVVNGQTAKATPGREFLIINLKITNDYDKTITINSRDYIRLTVNDSSEKLAADIHNDPVQVQAISTKYTRLGFPIYTTDKDLKLEVGEINGPKQTIKLTLQ